jgi:hypothetical protein
VTRFGLFLISAVLTAAPVSVPPDGWTAVRGSASPDKAVAREGKPSVRLEPGPSGGEALWRSAPLTLKPGNQYELSGWLRTDALEVADLDRSPIATGASLSMASMPWDVHSTSLGGSRGWQRVSLRFTAARSRDSVEVRVAQGGSFRGRAWVEGVAIEELSAPAPWPIPAAVKSFGPAYRYPNGGWIVLHIQGAPYERGFQHGFLMAKEIEGYIDRGAALINSKDRNLGWSQGRAIADALFLRGFDNEILQEMKGIAEGAAAAGAKYQGRKVDLLDIAAANTVTEIELIGPASSITPTGLEGLGLKPPSYYDPRKDGSPGQRCSSFAATGKATRDGRMVIAHITMWPLTLAEQTNVMLDVQPETGHRVLMQSYPGGIQSGTDWYQNDAGVVLAETTIRQTAFNPAGAPVAFRARKAIQYGTNIDLVVKHLSDKNNGLYTNEWLIGDAKNDEVAMFELGTAKSRLWRSTKNDWFGGTEGFYWGCNNAKGLEFRLQFMIDLEGRHSHVPWRPSDRDLAWVRLYDRFKGAIDEQFAFLAFRTAPLVSGSSMDAKVASAEMASNYMVWAVFGKPNEREWVAAPWAKEQYSGNEGIHSSGYRLFAPRLAPPAAAPAATAPEKPKPLIETVAEEKLWKGWILPASDADLWLSMGAADYRRVLASNEPDRALAVLQVRARVAALALDAPLSSLKTDVRSPAWADLAQAKGALVLDAVRREMGTEPFLTMMQGFFRSNSGKAVTTAQFASASHAQAVDQWVNGRGLPSLPAGPSALLTSFFPNMENMLIVYGTGMDAGSNRHAAELIQEDLLGWREARIPIRKDFELTEREIASRTLVFVGRPESNSALAAMLPALSGAPEYAGASFRIGGATYAHERDGLMWAGRNPANAGQYVLIAAGNSAVETVRLASMPIEDSVWVVTRQGKKTASGF